MSLQADIDSVRAWFAEWGTAVAAVDFESARPLFADDVSGFGTFKDFVHGLDALEQGQWRSIWPTIADFAFQSDNAEVHVSPDRLMATGAVIWTSTGFREDGTPYDRPGRATVVLTRDSVTDAWRGRHTHFSQFPAEQKLSFGESGNG